MTDPLETDLRTLLAARAAAVSPDTMSGEAAIARRLAHGDADLAEIVTLRAPRGRPWLVAAAVALVVAIGAAVVLQDGDPSVRSGPVATDPPEVVRAVLEFRPVSETGPCAAIGAEAFRTAPHDPLTCYRLGDPLPGNELLARASAEASPGEAQFSIAVTLTEDGIEQLNSLARQCYERSPTCLSGQLAIVVDGIVLSAPTIQQPGFEADQIQISGDFTEPEAEALAASLMAPIGAVTTTTPSSGATNDDPMVGDPSDSGNVVAERIALLVFGEEYVTVGRPSNDGVSGIVLLEGPRGDALLQFGFEADGAPRVVHIGPADDPLRRDAVAQDGSFSFEAPEAGELSYVAFDAGLVELSRGGAVAAPGSAVSLGRLSADVRWVAVRLETPDGRALVWLDPVERA